MTGRSYSLIVLLMFCIATPVFANQEREEEMLPSPELLEYLGQLVELDDEWIGPELFDIDEENEESEETDEDPATRDDKPPGSGEDSHE